MNPGLKRTVGTLAVVAVVIVLLILFPAAMAFVELAAREMRYLWWLVLLVAFALWLIFGFGRKSR